RFTLDALGHVVGRNYPSCTTSLNCTVSPWNGVTLPRTYRNGHIDTIGSVGTGTSFVTGVTYSPNDTTNTIAHSNGVVDTIYPDANGMPRPYAITFSSWSAGACQAAPIVTTTTPP